MEHAAELAPSRQGRYRSALQSIDLRRLLAAFVMVEIGAWSYSVVLSAFVFAQTGSAAAVGAMISVRWITGMLAAGPAGVIADRYERRKVLVVCSLLVTLVMLGMLVLIVSDAPIWMLALYSALNALVEAPNRPAAGALLPEVVKEDDLVTANVLLNLLENVVVVVGPLIGGLLILTGSPALAIGINACTYLAGALIYVRLTVRSHGSASEAGDSLARQWKTGIVALGSRPHAVALLVCVVLSTAMYGGQVIMFLAMSDDLGLENSGLSYFMAALATGGVLVAVIANRIAALPSLAYVVVGSLVVESLPFIAIGLTDNVPLILVLLVVSGAGTVMVDIIANTSFQRIMPNHLLGRTLATVTMMALLAGSLATMIAARLIALVGVSQTLILFGATLAVGGMLVLPILRRGEVNERQRSESLAGRVAFIERLDLFEGLNRVSLEGLAQAAVQVSMTPGTTLIAEGAPADFLWLLESGSLRVTTGDGQTVLNTLDAPGYAGEIGLLRNLPRTATVTVDSPSTLYRLDGQQFLDAIAASAPSTSLLRLVGDRISRRPGALPATPDDPGFQLAPA